jgi:hypothetical protein
VVGAGVGAGAGDGIVERELCFVSCCLL